MRVVPQAASVAQSCSDNNIEIPHLSGISCEHTMSQEERFAEFLTREDEVKSKLESRTEKVGPLLSLQYRAAIKAPLVAKKIHWLRMGAQTLANAVDGLAACRPGCDSCCHVPVLMLASEARVIGKSIGVVARDVPTELRNAPVPTWRGKDYPCPFLRDSLCSVRDNRPLACRILFNVDRDDYLCQHEESSSIVPYLDTRDFEINMVLAMQVPGDYVAELRDFFPSGLDS